MGERWHNRAHSHVNISRRGILNDFSPTENAPIPPTSHQKSEAAWKQMGSRSTSQKLEVKLHPWQGSENHREKGGTTNIQGRLSGYHNASQTPLSRGWQPVYTKKEVAGIYIKNSHHTPKINLKTHAGYTGRVPHKNNPPRHSEGMAGRTLRALGYKGQWDLRAEVPQGWWKQRFQTFGGCKQGLTCTGTQHKAVPP